MNLRICLFLAPLLVACPADDGETSAANTTPSTNTADESGSGSGGSGNEVLGCAFPEDQDSTDGMITPLMQTWGSACTTDAECVERIGAGGVCLVQAVVYELPLGYCAKPCMLPDQNTRVVMDDPACDPAGGIACVGQMGTFEYCTPLCTDDAQCNRDGYICRQMPIIAQPEDASLCLMPDCCQGTCDPND
jgi:hypothetical protein